MQAKISVIIPTYNRAHVIGRALESLIVQKYHQWECIIVDDGSTDYTFELLDFYKEKDSRIFYVKRPEKPKGAAHCRNIGLQKAEGKYIIFLDSDDKLLPHCLSQRIRKAEKIPSQDFYVFPMYIMKNGFLFSNKTRWSQVNFLAEFLKYQIPWQTMCTFWHAEFLHKIDGFDIRYSRLNDPEIHIRAIIASKGNFIVSNNSSEDSIYGINYLEEENSFSFAKKYFDSLSLFLPAIAEQLKKTGYQSHIPLLKNYLKNFLNLHYGEVSRVDLLELLRIGRNSEVITRREYWKILVQLNFLLIFNKFLLLQRRSLGKTLELKKK